LAPNWIFAIAHLFLLLKGQSTAASSKLAENGTMAIFQCGKLRLAPDSAAGIP
jgi:hypothetical protein